MMLGVHGLLVQSHVVRVLECVQELAQDLIRVQGMPLRLIIAPTIQHVMVSSKSLYIEHT